MRCPDGDCSSETVCGVLNATVSPSIRAVRLLCSIGVSELGAMCSSPLAPSNLRIRDFIISEYDGSGGLKLQPAAALRCSVGMPPLGGRLST